MDNLKTWPERLWINPQMHVSIYAPSPICDPNFEYIRADIAQPAQNTDSRSKLEQRIDKALRRLQPGFIESLYESAQPVATVRPCTLVNERAGVWLDWGSIDWRRSLTPGTKLYLSPQLPQIEPIDAAQIRNDTLEGAVNICEGLSKLYEQEDVGFDKGYSMAAQRAAKEINALKSPTAQSAKPGFIQQIKAAKESVQSWPTWMQDAAITATASLPQIAAQSEVVKKSVSGQEDTPLPKLPHTTYNGYADGSEPLYTREQMFNYARAACEVYGESMGAPAPTEPIDERKQHSIPEGIAALIERTNWTPKEALRFYADGKHFDVIQGSTRILDTGSIASNALKRMSIDYAEMKGDVALLDAELDERRAFEEAFAADNLPLEADWFWSDKNGNYLVRATAHAWHGWRLKANLGKS